MENRDVLVVAIVVAVVAGVIALILGKSYGTKIEAMAQAIAGAEGFGLDGAIPTRAHNPGDLKIPGWTGAILGEGISVFSDDKEGWDRLHAQLQLIADGRSTVYSLSDTIATMAQKWTPVGWQNWANNVAGELGVSIDTPLSQVLLEAA